MSASPDESDSLDDPRLDDPRGHTQDGHGAPSASGRAGFWTGVAAYLRATRLILTRSSLQTLLVAPAIVTLILFAAGTIAAFYFFADIRSALSPDLPSWIAWIAAALIIGIVWIFGFVVVGGLVAAPFCDLISKRIEALEGVRTDDPGSFVLETWSAIRHSAIRLVLYLATVAVFSLTLLVPGLGPTLFGTLMVILGIRYLAWDGVDYCLARRHYGFREKRRFLRMYSGATLGYGGIAFLLMLIPFANLFVLPLNAASGTVLYCALERQGGLPRRG